MALTFTAYTPDRTPIYGDIEVWHGKITFDSSYPTGGEAITATDFGSGVDEIVFVQISGGTSLADRLVYWDKANSKLMVYDEGAAVFAEAANASDMSGVIINAQVWVRKRP